MSTRPISFAVCLSCIAANRLVLSLRGLYFTQDLGNTTIATTNGKTVYNLRGLNQFRGYNSTFAVVPSSPEAVDATVEDEDFNRGDQAV